MRAVRVGICGLLAFAVLSFGGVEEWSQGLLELGASLLLLLWAVRQYRLQVERLQFPPEFAPVCALALLAGIQIIFRLTASRYFTRMELQLLLVYLIVLFLFTQVYLRISHWRSFIWFLMALGFFVSIFGILQHLTFNGKLYWLREMRFGGLPFGPYVNRNHFAGFAEMLIPIALVPLVLGKVRRERLFLVALFALVPMVALLLSASRGGIISLAVEMAILFLLLLVRKIRSKYVVVGGAVVLMAILMVSWIGVQQVLARFSRIQTMEVTESKRTAMRHDSWRLFLQHPVLGTGLGTFEMVFPPYDTDYDGKVVNHAHNDYLEMLAETGIVGGVCCAWFLVVVLLNALRGLEQLGNSFSSALNLSGLVACSGILVHSLVDFNLHIPANALLFIVCAHLATVHLQSNASGTGENHVGRRRNRKQ